MIAKRVETKDERLERMVEIIDEQLKDADAQEVLEAAGTYLVHALRRIETAQEQALPHTRILEALGRMVEKSRAEAGFGVKRS